MIYIFLPKAKEDFNEAIDHYNLEQPGLGLRFRDEIQKLIEAIVADPLLWRERKGGYRHAALSFSVLHRILNSRRNHCHPHCRARKSFAKLLEGPLALIPRA